MESMIKDNMMSHLSSNKRIDDSQHGFLPSHSTTYQHLKCCYDWDKSADEGKPTDVVYIDFSKAFDGISHDKFAQKIKSYNFCNNTVKCFLAFLTNRTQAVKSNNSVSSSVPVTSGTPEGSVCGPQYFIFFINNLSSICSSCKIKLMLMISKFIFTLLNQVIRLFFNSALTEFLTGLKYGSCVSPMINVNYYKLAILILVFIITLVIMS